MAGNANSGRPKLYEEWNKISAINKLWAKINNKVMAGEELSEYEEKLVLALLPKTIKTEQDITSGDKPLPLLTYALLNNNGHSESNGNEETDTDNTGGNVSE